VCPVNEAAKLTFLWREFADGSQPGAIDISHKGPCAVYMKAVKSAVEDPGHGAGWFKIWDSGYDASTSECRSLSAHPNLQILTKRQGCTEKLIKNNGLLSVDVPADLAGGYYLVRPEILALHQADKSPPNPQFYTGCAQIFLESSGTAVPSNTVSIPGHVNAGDASVLFNIYTPSWPYPLPGPAPYVAKSVLNMGSKALTPVQPQTEGLMPDGCVLSNANCNITSSLSWSSPLTLFLIGCGLELDSYSTEAGCWNVSATEQTTPTVFFVSDTTITNSV
jgi:hypothetical protein